MKYTGHVKNDPVCISLNQGLDYLNFTLAWVLFVTQD